MQPTLSSAQHYAISYNSPYPDLTILEFPEVPNHMDCWTTKHCPKQPAGTYYSVLHTHSFIFFETGATSLANLNFCLTTIEHLERDILTYTHRLTSSNADERGILIKEISKDKKALVHYTTSAAAIQLLLLQESTKFAKDHPQTPT